MTALPLRWQLSVDVPDDMEANELRCASFEGRRRYRANARHYAAKIGRKWSLLIWTLVFSIGAVSVVAVSCGTLEPDRPVIALHIQILQTVAGGSRGLAYIYAGRVIAGLGIGAISAVAPAFVSECSPKDVRGRITGLFQIMVAVGVMLSYFINRTSLCPCSRPACGPDSSMPPARHDRPRARSVHSRH